MHRNFTAGATAKPNVEFARRPMVSYALWIAQALLALLFLFTGGMKLVVPMDVLIEQMPGPLPAVFVRFLGAAEVVVDAQHLGAFAREGERGGAAVADTLAGALAGANDDGDLVLEAHVSSLPESDID